MRGYGADADRDRPGRPGSRQLFNDACDLGKTARDRGEKVCIIQNYLTLLEERKKQGLVHEANR